MTQKNRYLSRSKLTEAKFRQILRYFAMDLTATDCAQLSGISIRSVNGIYLRIRRRLAEHCEQVSPLGGELEAYESYFGLAKFPRWCLGNSAPTVKAVR
jgi:transposase